MSYAADFPIVWIIIAADPNATPDTISRVTDFPIIWILIVVAIALLGGSILLFILLRVYKPKNVEEPVNNPKPVADIPRPAAKKFKRCPVCESAYTDENLNYCLTDGAQLEGASDEVETVVRRIN